VKPGHGEIEESIMSPTPDDPTIDEVHAIHERISERFGHDPRRLVEYYSQVETNNPPVGRRPMSYSDFDLKTAVQTFGLSEDRTADLFAGVEPMQLDDSLRAWLDELAPVALGVNSEKARSEFIIAPMLIEARRRAGPPVNVLPGVAFDVDKARGLNWYCDFLIARSTEIYYVQAPVVAVVEAKKEDLIAGLGQCVAAMVAIGLFNEREGTTVPAVYGCVTSGSNWRFLKLEGSVLRIDRPEYYLRDAGKILAILVQIIGG
jgi:hypothetical protein